MSQLIDSTRQKFAKIKVSHSVRGLHWYVVQCVALVKTVTKFLAQ